jgi:hypothetical protein
MSSMSLSKNQENEVLFVGFNQDNGELYSTVVLRELQHYHLCDASDQRTAVQQGIPL